MFYNSNGNDPAKKKKVESNISLLIHFQGHSYLIQQQFMY